MIRLTASEDGATVEISQTEIAVIETAEPHGWFKSRVFLTIRRVYPDGQIQNVGYFTKESRDEILALMKAEREREQLEYTVRNLALQRQSQEAMLEIILTKCGVPH